MMPFASATLLLWGLAAAIPIAIHLWSRRRHEEHAWAAMAFLMAALRQHARRARFQEWLLLTLRIAVLVLFAIALADPRTAGRANSAFPLAGGEPTHHVLVIDASYSMDLRHGERTGLDRAREAALAIVRNAPQGDGFSLVLLADPASVVLGEPVFDTAAVEQELNALRTAPAGADLTSTLARVRELLAQARQRVPRLARRHVVVFSDMARNTWDPGNQATGDWRRSWQELAEAAVLEVRDVGPRTTSDLVNLAIVALRSAAVVEGPVARHDLQAGGEGRLEAVLRNFGSRATSATVEFQVDGRPLAAPAITVPPRGEAVATARVRFDSPGDHVAKATLRAVRPPDELPLDDHRWLVIPVRDRGEVLCVEGGLDEARFLALALAPGTRGATAARDAQSIRVGIASETALLDRSLHRYDLIALCNVARLSDRETQAIGDYVYRGGRLAIFPGDRTDIANFNERLGGRPRRLLPASLGPPRSQDDLRIDPRGYRDPLIAPFRGQERAGLLSTPIWCYLPATVIDANAARVALAFHNGDPWLVHEPFGAGHVWLCTTTAAPRSRIAGSDPPRPWNAWATWPSFVPLMQTLLHEALAGRSAVRNILVGGPLTGAFAQEANDSSRESGTTASDSVGDNARGNTGDNASGNAIASGESVLVELPSPASAMASAFAEPAETQRIAAERVGFELRWLLPATSIPGIYVARPSHLDSDSKSKANASDTLSTMSPRGDSLSSERDTQATMGVEQRFAVNIDTRESDPQRIDADDLPASLRESFLASNPDASGLSGPTGAAATPGVFRGVEMAGTGSAGTGSAGTESAGAESASTGSANAESADDGTVGAKEPFAEAGRDDRATRAVADSGQRRWFRPLLAMIAMTLVAESLLAWRMGRRGGA